MGRRKTKNLLIDSYDGPLLPVPKEYEAAWARLQLTHIKGPMRRALYLIAHGCSERVAAHMLGGLNRDHLRLYVQSLGFSAPKTGFQIAMSRQLADAYGNEIEKRLATDPASWTNKDLMVGRGIEMDKIAKHENWGRELELGRGGEFGDALSEIAARVSQAGASLKLELTVEPAQFGPQERLVSEFGPPDQISPELVEPIEIRKLGPPENDIRSTRSDIRSTETD